jgi:hypothetical protein
MSWTFFVIARRRRASVIDSVVIDAGNQRGTIDVAVCECTVSAI